MHLISVGYYYYYQEIDSTSLVIRKPQIKIRFHCTILEWQNFVKGLVVHSVGKRVKKVVHVYTVSGNTYWFFLSGKQLKVKAEVGCRRKERQNMYMQCSKTTLLGDILNHPLHLLHSTLCKALSGSCSFRYCI